MKIFESNINTLRKSSPAKLSRRFVCCVIDLILVALLAEAIFAGMFLITKSTPAYASAEATLTDEIAFYKEFTEETHIVEYVDGQRVTTDVTVIKNLYRAICLSYEHFGNNQQPDFIVEPGHDVTINGVHSVETDNVAYFYTRYLKEHPEVNIKTVDLFEIYRRSFGDNASLMFVFDNEKSSIPILNTQVAYYIYHYFFINSSDSIGQSGAAYYDSYYKGYANMLEEAETLILQSEPYYSTHYVKYMEAYSDEARYTNIALTVSIIISCLIILLIPKYLFKDERTIGYKLFGLGVIGLDGMANKWYVPLIKTLCECIGFIPVAFILYMFPPFNGGYDAMFIPIVPGIKLSFAWVIIAIMVLVGIVNIPGLFTQKKQNLLNMIFSDYVVDVHHINEGEREEPNEGRSY